MVQLSVGTRDSAAQLLNEPTTELVAYLSSAERMQMYECSGKTFQPRDFAEAEALGVETDGDLRLTYHYDLVRRGGSRYRYHRIGFRLEEGRVRKDEVRRAFDGSDRSSLSLRQMSGLIYSGGGSDVVLEDPGVGYGVGYFGHQQGFPELASSGHPFEASSDGLEYLFPDPFAEQRPSKDWRSREEVSVAKLVLSPERDYAPAFVERGSWYQGEYVPGVRLSSIDGERIDGVWVPAVIEMSRFRRSGSGNERKWDLRKRMVFDLNSFVFVDEFQEGDFFLDFPEDSYYLDRRTGERVGTPPAARAEQPEAQSMSRAMVALVVACALLVAILLFVRFFKHRNVAHGFLLFVVLAGGCATFEDVDYDDDQRVLVIEGGDQMEIVVPVGEVLQVSRAVRLFNQSERNLVLGEPRAGCGCTNTILSSADLGPGESTELNFTIDITSEHTSKWIDIILPYELKNGERDEHRLLVNVRADADWSVESDRLFLEGGVGEEIEFDIFLRGRMPSDAVAVSMLGVECSILDDRELEPGRSRMRIRAVLPADPVTRECPVTLECGTLKPRKLDLVAMLSVNDRVYPDPSVIASRDEPVFVKLVTGSNVTIQAVEGLADHARVHPVKPNGEVDAREGSRRSGREQWKLQIQPGPDAELQREEVSVEVVTNHGRIDITFTIVDLPPAQGASRGSPGRGGG